MLASNIFSTKPLGSSDDTLSIPAMPEDVPDDAAGADAEGKGAAPVAGLPGNRLGVLLLPGAGRGCC